MGGEKESFSLTPRNLQLLLGLFLTGQLGLLLAGQGIYLLHYRQVAPLVDWLMLLLVSYFP